MQRLICFTALVSLFCVQELWAQNINLISVDSSRWPEVDVVAALPDGNVNAGDYALRLAAEGALVNAAYISGPLPNDPISMVVALDTCQSLSPELLHSAKQALLEYVEYLDANERMAILAFNESIEIESDFVGDRRTFREVLAELYPTQNKTRLYINLLYSIDLLKNMPGRRHILLVADGEDTDGGLALEQVLQSARENNVKIFTVGLDTVSGENVSENMEGLTELAQATGGFHYKANSVDELQSGVYGLLDQQRSLARSERRHLYKLRFNLEGRPPRGVMNADLIRTDGRDIRFVNFYLPRPGQGDSAVWEGPAKVSMKYSNYQAMSAAPPAGEGDSRLWYNPMFWLLPIGFLALSYWLWRRYKQIR